MYERSFRNSSNVLTCSEDVTHRSGRSKFPFLLCIKSVCVNSSLKEPTCFFCQQRKRILKSVIYLTKKSGAKLCREHFTGKHYLISALDTTRHFINLYLRNISTNTDNLALKRSFFVYHNEADLVHRNVAFKFDRHKISIDTNNFTYIFGHHLTSNSSPPKMEL